MSEENWYGIANFGGGYTYSRSYEDLRRWKEEDFIREPIEDVTAKLNILRKHEFFHYFNDLLVEWPGHHEK